MNTPSPVLVVDMHNLARSVFHNIPTTLTAPDGRVTNAVKGFVSCMGAAINQFRPSEVIIANEGRHNRRRDIYPKYKGNRDKAPELFAGQPEMIIEFCEAAGYVVVTPDVGEADDVIASVAKQRPDHEVLIYSSDKDVKVCVSDRVFIVNRRGDKSGGLDKLGVEDVVRNFRVFPHQITDYLAMVGDKGDNVPKMPGFGPEKAVELLNRFGTADNMFMKRGVMKLKLSQEVEAGEPAFRLSKQLIQLDDNIPIPPHTPLPGMANAGKLIQVLSKFGIEANISKLLRTPQQSGPDVEPDDHDSPEIF